MLGKFFDKILHEDEELLEEEEEREEEETKKFKRKDLIGALAVFLLALLPRLAFLFTHNPQDSGYFWYGDVYHRWQIAYLSKTVGFQHGFLRLWDLKGMEYFWGLLHPLASIFLFTLTGSIDIILVRLLSIVPGSLVVAFVYLLVKRDFNSSAAWASALLMAFFPVILFSDTLGMQEPLGLVLLFAGFLLWPRHGLLTGFFWGLAAMERAEYWLFSLALFLASLWDKKARTGAKITLSCTWVIVIGLYMKYLGVWTGNHIYPIYWNFLSSVVGQWLKKGQKPPPYFPNQYAFQAKLLAMVVFFLALVAVFRLLKQRKRYYLWFLVGVFNLGFIGFMFGFAAYSQLYIERFWVDRLLAWPYGFLGILLSILLLYSLPKKIKFWQKLKLGWLVWGLILGASMLFWKPINYYFTIAQNKIPWEYHVNLAKETVSLWDKKGKILVPETMPAYIYTLVRNEGVKGDQIIGQKYDVFAYLEEDPFANWSENWPKVKAWLEEENISLMVNPGDKGHYFEMYKRQDNDFKFLGDVNKKIYFYQPTWRE